MTTYTHLVHRQHEGWMTWCGIYCSRSPWQCCVTLPQHFTHLARACPDCKAAFAEFEKASRFRRDQHDQ